MKSPVERLEFSGDEVASVRLRDGRQFRADWVISAVPPNALLKMLPDEVVQKVPAFGHLQQLRYAPIISIHLWLDRRISSLTFAGLLDTHIQWFFNKSKIYEHSKRGDQYISLVISGAHAFIDWNDSALLTMVLADSCSVSERSRKPMTASASSATATRHAASRIHPRLSGRCSPSSETRPVPDCQDCA